MLPNQWDALWDYISINSNFIWYAIAFPFVFLRIWTILFVTKDISHRTSNLFYQLFCILLTTFWTPFIWFPMYFIIRPYRTLDDIVWRDTINSLGIKCLECWEINHIDNKYCVNCWDYIKIECKECKEKYNQTFEYCPNCGAPSNLELK